MEKPTTEQTPIPNHPNGFQFCPPCRKMRRKENTEAIYVMVRHNYRVYANTGFKRRQTGRFTVILDTGASSSVIRKDFIPPRMWEKIKNRPDAPRIRDASSKRISVSGKIELMVEFWSRVEVISLKFVKSLATKVILGFDFCDKHVESMNPWKKTVQLDDGTQVPSCEELENDQKTRLRYRTNWNSRHHRNGKPEESRCTQP